MSLPDAWVDRIFTKLSLVYGHQFLSRWDGLDMADVKADWAHELSGYQQSPQAIAHALENLPTSKPPTVLEFRELCRAGPQRAPERPRIENSAPVRYIDRETVREELSRMRTAMPKQDPKAWATVLQEKDRKYPHLVTPTVRAMYRRALKLES